MRDDVLARLRAADPVAGTDLARMDRGVLDALREGVTMTERSTRRGLRRRLGRGGFATAVTGIAVLGGGVAYAGYEQWYVGGGASHDGVNCRTEWADPTAMRDTVGGPELTGDPLADCRRYMELVGRPPIPDPVAFHHQGTLYVAPRSEVPEGAEPLAPPAPEDDAAFELEASMQDYVDGPQSRCFSEAETTEFASRELARLGLSGWTVTVVPADNPGGNDGLPCAVGYADPATRQAHVLPHRAAEEHGVGGDLATLRDTLRERIADQCVGLREAEAIAEEALGVEHHWPLSAIPDPGASCTRVDLVIGGSIQVTLRGPDVAAP
ncbi:hypothetical protein CLV92_103331 [Kineococcus xinjiangensis]|uniref:Uncharacterized protein n=1 Tax=Kineococcus xinjiangensis TaxID=512762 RepID=A0A2S6IUT1_9ACTN|nr:hypothetical protein [Kineococcus xinjiangensis]PPK97796.1 hypothetical protein CLV92_103331 [Kineococcus xinjiangensis]